MKDFDCTDRLNQISIPVLLTCGEWDEATPEALSLFSQQIPDSEVHVFAGASHNHHLEQPDEYLQVLKHFLSR